MCTGHGQLRRFNGESCDAELRREIAGELLSLMWRWTVNAECFDLSNVSDRFYMRTCFVATSKNTQYGGVLSRQHIYRQRGCGRGAHSRNWCSVHQPGDQSATTIDEHDRIIDQFSGSKSKNFRSHITPH